MAVGSLLTSPGRFVVGCNYWASHAGTRMWSDWREEVVEEDLRRLSEAGQQVLRVFPLWPDFQPIHLLRGGGGQPVEFRHGEEPLPDTPWGRAGLSAVAMERFATFADLAEQHDLKLLVGLVTGWMSGRLHVPPALEGLNVLTDPAALQWELRFVREFVKAFRDHPAVIGWDLGNECNCMGAATHEQAYVWTAAIANAIRAEDRTRPVVSGMHSLSPKGSWRPDEQGELTDLLTTHPYPVFTPHCDQDPVNTPRSILHSTAESRLYADLGGQPCLCQELGTLGPVIASEAVAADYVRSCLFSLWANDCHGLLWWCAFDQTELPHAPYDWHAVERELGLLRVDGSRKPVAEVMGRFRRTVEAMPFEVLPTRRREAVCILTEGQDTWGVAYSTFALAKQAGFDLEFQCHTEPLREAELYLLPCLSGHAMISRRRLHELLDRVAAGATLYLSLDTGLPSDFEPITGLEPQTRQRRRRFEPVRLEGVPGAPELPNAGTHQVNVAATRARVLGNEADGNPICSVVDYGRGRVFYLGLPLEMTLTRTPGAFHEPGAPACWQWYRHFAAQAMRDRALTKQSPVVMLTEHDLAPDRRAVVAINPMPLAISESLAPQGPWRLAEVLHGQAEAAGEQVQVSLPPNEAAVLLLKR